MRKRLEETIGLATARLIKELTDRPAWANLGEYVSLRLEAAYSTDPNRPWLGEPDPDHGTINVSVTMTRAEAW